MIAFRSGWRRQIRLVIIIPHSARIINGRYASWVVGDSMDNIRMIPYPPNFRRIAAKTIDPAIGASTCALGSQR